MGVYSEKEGENNGKMKKHRFLHLNFGIRVYYFWLQKSNKNTVSKFKLKICDILIVIFSL